MKQNYSFTVEQSNEISDDVWIDVSSNDETPANANVNAADVQPEAEAQLTPRVEATPTPELNTRKQYPTRVCCPPDRL